MKQILCCLVLFALCFPSMSQAVEFQDTPIQSAITEQLNQPLLAMSDDEWTMDDESEDGEADKPGVTGRKPVWKAAALSALLPGAGEFYLGNKKKATYFFAAEAITWIGYFSFRSYGAWKKDDMIQYAAEHASAQLDGKDREFEDWVGFYTSVEEFNILGRATDDRPFLSPTSSNYWRWTSASEQSTYRDLKNDYRDSYRRADFMLGVAVVSRIISVIDAVRDARRQQRTIDNAFGVQYRFEVDPLATRNQVRLTLYPGF